MTKGWWGFFLCVWTLNDHGVPEVIDDQFYPIDHVGSYILPHHWVRQGIWFNQMYMAIFDKTSILEKKISVYCNYLFIIETCGICYLSLFLFKYITCLLTNFWDVMLFCVSVRVVLTVSFTYKILSCGLNIKS